MMFLKTTTPTCAYCGKRFEHLKFRSHDLSKMSLEAKEEVKRHVVTCPENPLNKEIEQLKTELKKIEQRYNTMMETAGHDYAELEAENKKLKAECKWLKEGLRRIRGVNNNLIVYSEKRTRLLVDKYLKGLNDV